MNNEKCITKMTQLDSTLETNEDSRKKLLSSKNFCAGGINGDACAVSKDRKSPKSLVAHSGRLRQQKPFL